VILKKKLEKPFKLIGRQEAVAQSGSDYAPYVAHLLEEDPTHYVSSGGLTKTYLHPEYFRPEDFPVCFRKEDQIGILEIYMEYIKQIQPEGQRLASIVVWFK